MIYYFGEFIGKKLKMDLDELEASEDDVETDGVEYCTKILDYRPYLEEEEIKDIEETDDEEYDERRNWSLETSLNLTVDEENVITEIEIGARVSCYGDSGLGDCNPDDEWTPKDFEAAEKFLKRITE